jgi:hypothetical protein
MELSSLFDGYSKSLENIEDYSGEKLSTPAGTAVAN